MSQRVVIKDMMVTMASQTQRTTIASVAEAPGFDLQQGLAKSAANEEEAGYSG